MNEQSLVTRVNRLEQENRWMKLAGVLVLLGIAAVMVMGQAKPNQVAKIIEAEKIVLRDARSMVRLDPEGLIFSSLSNRSQLSVGLGLGGASLLFTDKNGKNRMDLIMWASGHSGLYFNDEHGKNRVALQQSVIIDQPVLALSDKNRSRLVLRISKDGSPALVMSDKDGKERVVVGSSDVESTRTGTVTMLPESSIVLFDKEEKVIWKAP